MEDVETLYKIGLKFYKEKQGKSAALQLKYSDNVKLIACTKQVRFGPYDSEKQSFETQQLGFFDFIGNDRIAAWKHLGQMDKKEAMQTYIDILQQTCPSFLPYVKAHLALNSNISNGIHHENNIPPQLISPNDPRFAMFNSNNNDDQKFFDYEAFDNNPLSSNPQNVSQLTNGVPNYGTDVNYSPISNLDLYYRTQIEPQLLSYVYQLYPTQQEQREQLLNELRNQYFSQATLRQNSNPGFVDNNNSNNHVNLNDGQNGANNNDGGNNTNSCYSPPSSTPKEQNYTNPSSTQQLDAYPSQHPNQLSMNQAQQPLPFNKPQPVPSNQIPNSIANHGCNITPKSDILRPNGDLVSFKSGKEMHTKNNEQDADTDEEETAQYIGDIETYEINDHILPASMWTRKEVKEFKQDVKTNHNECMIKVGHGETVTIRVPTHQKGSALFWEFSSDSYDIGFGAFFEWSYPLTDKISVHVSQEEDEDEEGDLTEDENEQADEQLIETGKIRGLNFKALGDVKIDIAAEHKAPQISDVEKGIDSMKISHNSNGDCGNIAYNGSSQNSLPNKGHRPNTEHDVETNPVIKSEINLGPNVSNNVVQDPTVISIDEIIPLERRDAHMNVFVGTHPYPGQGVYLLKFDNSYSLWRSKTIYYKIYYTK